MASISAEVSWRRYLIQRGCPEDAALELIPDGLPGGEARSIALQVVQ